MNVGVNGLVVNGLGQVLLIRRDDSRTWALPGGALEAGELPTSGAAREVEEETGLKVLPVRLAGVYFSADRGYGYLIFLFRCLVQGGTLAPSEESPRVGYFSPQALPRPMTGLSRERLEQAYRHAGGPAYWGQQRLSRRLQFYLRLVAPLVYRWKDLRRWRRGQPRYQAPRPWQVGVFVVIRDPAGRVLWVRRRDYDVWNLPGGRVEAGEAPWQAAGRETREETGLEVRLTNLTGVYVKPDGNELVLAFTADVAGGELAVGPEAAAFDWFAPGQEPPDSLPKQVERAADAAGGAAQTLFKIQAGPPGLVALGLRPG